MPNKGEKVHRKLEPAVNTEDNVWRGGGGGGL